MAVEMTWRLAERSPPTSSGAPKGISTRPRIWSSLIPLARAPSTAMTEAARTPLMAPARTLGRARMTKAIMGAVKPTPSARPNRVMRPRVGRERAAPLSGCTQARRARCGPPTSQLGTPMRAAMRTPASEYAACWIISGPIPMAPLQ